MPACLFAVTYHCHMQVHQGVELRVKAAMARAEQLEAQQELAAAQHAQHTQQLQQQQADLEAALQEARQHVADLQAQLEAAHAAGVCVVAAYIAGGQESVI